MEVLVLLFVCEQRRQADVGRCGAVVVETLGNLAQVGFLVGIERRAHRNEEQAVLRQGAGDTQSLVKAPAQRLGEGQRAAEESDLREVAKRLDDYSATATYVSLPPLFANKQEYEDFHARHLKATGPQSAPKGRQGTVAFKWRASSPPFVCFEQRRQADAGRCGARVVETLGNLAQVGFLVGIERRAHRNEEQAVLRQGAGDTQSLVKAPAQRLGEAT